MWFTCGPIVPLPQIIIRLFNYTSGCVSWLHVWTCRFVYLGNRHPSSRPELYYDGEVFFFFFFFFFYFEILLKARMNGFNICPTFVRMLKQMLKPFKRT